MVGVVGRAVRGHVGDGDARRADEALRRGRRGGVEGVLRGRDEHDGVVVDRVPVEVEGSAALQSGPVMSDGLAHDGDARDDGGVVVRIITNPDDLPRVVTLGRLAARCGHGSLQAHQGPARVRPRPAPRPLAGPPDRGDSTNPLRAAGDRHQPRLRALGRGPAVDVHAARPLAGDALPRRGNAAAGDPAAVDVHRPAQRPPGVHVRLRPAARLAARVPGPRDARVRAGVGS